MASTIKVNTIQNVAGSAPLITDLGMKVDWFQTRITTASYTAAGGTQKYAMDTFEGTGASFNDSTDTITITAASVWKINLFLGCASTGNGDARWQENYIYHNSTRVLDTRHFVININTDNEYYGIHGSKILTCAAGDTIYVSGNGQLNWSIDGGSGSNFHAIRLA